MKTLIRHLTLLIGGIIIMTAATNKASAQDEAMQTDNAEKYMYLDLDHGRVVIELLPDIAPGHVERITSLAKEGFYDGVVFHRVIEGFMAQTGDPTGTGRGGSELPDIDAEFSDYKYKRGTVGMARTSDPNSANSQFFICFDDEGCSFLTGQYTVFGQVVKGMQHVDALAVGEPPASPDAVKGVRLEATPDEL